MVDGRGRHADGASGPTSSSSAATTSASRDRRYAHPAADALAPLSAPHGVLAVLGNHDDDRETSGGAGGEGLHGAADARTRLTIRGEAVDFAGIRFWTYKVVDIAHVLRGAVPLHVPAGASRRSGSSRRSSSPCRPSSAATRTADRSSCRASARSRRASFPSSPASSSGRARRSSSAAASARSTCRCGINCPPEVAVLTLEPDARVT